MSGGEKWAGWLDSVPNCSFREALTALEGADANAASLLREAATILEALRGSSWYFTDLLADRAIQLSVDEAAAILYYTTDEGCGRINKPLRGALQSVGKVALVARLLFGALQKLRPRPYTFAERGVAATREMFEHPEQHFSTGQRVPMEGFCGFSTNAQRADEFARRSAAAQATPYFVVYIVRNLKGVPLKAFSRHADDDEVMPVPTAVFTAQSWHRIDGGNALFVYLSHSQEDSARLRYVQAGCASSVEQQEVGAAWESVDSRLVERECVRKLSALLCASLGQRRMFLVEGGHGVGKSCAASMAVRRAMVGGAGNNERVPYNAVLRLDGSLSLQLSLKQSIWRELEKPVGRELTVLELWRAWVDENPGEAVAVIVEDVDDGIGSAGEELLSIIGKAPHRYATEHFLVTSHTAPKILKLMGTEKIAVGRLCDQEVVAMLNAAGDLVRGDAFDEEDFVRLCGEVGDMHAFHVSRLIDDLVNRCVMYGEWATGVRAELPELRGRGDFGASLAILLDRLLKSISSDAQRALCVELMTAHHVLNSASIPLFVLQRLLGLGIDDADRRLQFIALKELLQARGVASVTATAAGVRSIVVHQWHWRHADTSDETSERVVEQFEACIALPALNEHQKRSWLDLFVRIPARLLTTIRCFDAASTVARETSTGVLAVFEKLESAKHLASVSRRANILGVLLMALGRFEASLEWFREGLFMRRRELPEGHVDIGVSLNNVAAVLVQLGRNDEALEAARCALEIRRKGLPPDHPDTGNTWSGLAVILANMGRDEEALKEHEGAVASLRSGLPAGHPDIAFALSNMAAVLLKLRRVDDALEMFRTSLEIRRRAFPEGHPDIAMSLNNVAGVLSHMGRHEEALEMFRETLAMRRRSLPSAHPDIAMSLNNIGASLNSTLLYGG